jgi:spoIIIJ-associated protein
MSASRSEQKSVPGGREQAQAVLRDLLRLMGFEAKVESFDQAEHEVLLHIESPDAGRLIGHGAQGLEALQLVVNRMMGRQAEQPARFIVDIERYRERKRDRLLKMALDAAERVRQTGRPEKLPPMNASDRRVIHQALKNQKDLRTWSEILGDKQEKQVVVGKAEPSTVETSPPADPMEREIKRER